MPYHPGSEQAVGKIINSMFDLVGTQWMSLYNLACVQNLLKP